MLAGEGMKYLLGILVMLLTASYASAQASLDDIGGLPSGSELLVTDTTVSDEPVTASEPAPAAPETGPADIALVVGGVAVLGFILIKSRPAKHARL